MTERHDPMDPTQSKEEVIKRFEEWLAKPGSIESLREAFEEADRLGQELSRRAEWPPRINLTLDEILHLNRRVEKGGIPRDSLEHHAYKLMQEPSRSERLHTPG